MGVKLKSTLDVLASVCMIAAAFAIFWAIWFRTPPVQRAIPGATLPSRPIEIADAATLGSRQAKVAIVVFSDFECPFCAQFATKTFPGLKSDYIDQGYVLFVFKHLPLPIHTNAINAGEAVECAGKQEKFWTLHDVFFNDPAQIAEVGIPSLATRAGLDMKLFSDCLGGNERVKVLEDLQLARELDINGSPTFMLGINEGQGERIAVKERFSGAAPLTRFKTSIDALLSGNP